MTSILVVGDSPSGSIVRSRLKAIGMALVAGLGGVPTVLPSEIIPAWDLLEAACRDVVYMLRDWWYPPLSRVIKLCQPEPEQRVLKGHIRLNLPQIATNYS